MGVKRNIYLKMKTLNEARETVINRFSKMGLTSGERVHVPDAVGRVLAKPVTARQSAPNFHAAAMDGIAVKANHTFGASEKDPKQLTVGKEAFYLNTGHVMPDNTDAVIMIENVNTIDDNLVEIEAPVFPWQHVRKLGEDIVATELLFPQNHLVTPYCVGALLAGGIFNVQVRRKPNILIIPTGSELVDWHDPDAGQLKPGQVLETNSYVLGKIIEECGAVYERHEKIPDDLNEIKHAVAGGLNKNFDAVLILGGSSAGSEDYAKGVIGELGSILVHGVTMMPGKPVIIGDIASKPVFGIPGYPVSAIIAFEQFVKPLISQLLGQPEQKPDTIQVETTRKIASKLGVEEFLRVKLGQVGKRVVATSLPRGAGSITSITEADGIIRIPNQIEGINTGQQVTAELLRPAAVVNNTIVIVGSHDNTIDVLSDHIRASNSRLTLSSSHVGSMGGLMAIKKGVCHLAGSHLLDTGDGSYNVSYIEKYIPNAKVKLINLVLRDQGLIVSKGNPKRIKGIEDLTREDVSMINRQSGSGTRILLDYQLKKLGLEPSTILGYENDEFTHMSVAVAVLSGTADVGLGIFAAAKALELEFIPVVTEQYDLVIPEVYYDTEPIQFLLSTIKTDEFKKQVETLGGYSTEKTGEVIL